MAAADALWLLALIELRSSDWALAATYIEQSAAHREMLDEQDHWTLFPRALLAVYSGEVADAQQYAERGLELAELAGYPIFANRFRGVLGQIALWSDDPASAIDYFAAALEQRTSLGHTRTWAAALPSRLHRSPHQARTNRRS